MAVNQIRHVDSPGKDGKDNEYTYYPVLIIGAGESGIAMGCRLRSQLGFDQFRIFDRRSGLGGTWYANRYPGIACDIPAVLYSFSWFQNPGWTGPFPSGKEIVQYLYEACAHFGILDKIQLDTDVRSIVWKEEDQEWEVVLDHLSPGVGDMSSAERANYEKANSEKAAGAAAPAVLRSERVRAKVVVSAAGGLVEPKPFVDVPGIDTFPGEIVHTARWDPKLDVRDKDVVVVGTGCSAGQVVPQLIKPEYGARHVTQLLRSPPWATPFLSEEETKVWSRWMPWLCSNIPGFQFTFRKLLFASFEVEWLAVFQPTEAARARRAKKAERLLKYMRSKVPEKYHEILTPDYEVFCKRRVIDDGWFASLQDPKVEITSLPLRRIDGNTVHLGPGRHYPPMSKTDSQAPTEEREIHADVIIMANGYETSQWLHPLDVIGRDGRSLHQVWDERGGAQAYLGIAMDGFPNFFMIFGPNTATGHSSVILASENMVNYTLNFVRGILQGDVRTWEVSEKAEREWAATVQCELKDSVFSAGCVNWYRQQDNGWNSTVYHRSQVDHTLRCWFPVWWHWHGQYTRKGLVKLYGGRLLKVLAAGLVVWRLARLVRLVRGGQTVGQVVRENLAKQRNLLQTALYGLASLL